MRKTSILIFVMICNQVVTNAQVVTPVLDDEHNATTVIETTAKGAAATLKAFFTSPAFEKISKVQSFLKDAVQVVSAVVANLKMTRQLIEAEQDIYDMYIRSRMKISQADGLEDRWKYNKVLLTLYFESVKAFEVFDLATQENMGIIDDKGRITLIKEVLKKTRAIRRAMRVTLRRANQAILRLKVKQRELETFKNLFSF